VTTARTRALTASALPLALAFALAAGCGKSETSDPEPAGGTSPAGGSGNGSGGASGSPATGGTAQGGSSDAGTSGSSAEGGSGAGGGSAGTSNGGSSGSGSGGGPTGVVGTLGGECAPPGSLACTGNFQKVSLLCGADGRWAANQTCSTGEFCDTTPGPNAGTCAPQAPECEGREPGTPLCLGKDLWECGPDTVTVVPKMECEGSCRDGACSAADPCLDDAIDCAGDCRGRDDLCWECGGPAYNSTVRIGAADGCAVTCGGTVLQRFTISTSTSVSSVARVSPPWRVVATSEFFPDYCALNVDAQSCAETVAGPDVNASYIIVLTDEPSPPPHNISVEEVGAMNRCSP
jgi:hypothetical protein